MKPTKFITSAVASVLGLALLAGCSASTSSTLTFDVSTGDSVAVTLDTTDGYKLVEDDGSFGVERDGETILMGSFLTEDAYDEQAAAIGGEGVEVVEESESDGNPYVFYEYTEDGTVNELFLVWIDGSDTGILLGGLSGTDASAEAFDALSFGIEE